MHRKIFQIAGILAFCMASHQLVAQPPKNKSASKTHAPQDTMLLCDKGTGTGKLVYAYIDGQKTPCMSEQALRALLNQRHFDSDTAFKRTQSELVAGGDIIAQIQQGQKSFRKLNLSGADLMRLDLSGFDLRETNLQEADLRGANLTGADLRGALLGRAFFMKTILRGAKLDSADLTGAYMMNADLTKAQGLTLEMLKGPVSLYNAVIDSGLLSAAQKEFPEKFVSKKSHWKSELRPESESQATED